MDSIEHNRMWEIIDLPAGHRPITQKWVFKLKKNEVVEVVKHKVRLIAHGFIQQEGIDYDDAFTPVARIKSIHIFLALAAQEGWRSITWMSSLLSSMATSRRRCTCNSPRLCRLRARGQGAPAAQGLVRAAASTAGL
jgi:hypothetical protein